MRMPENLPEDCMYEKCEFVVDTSESMRLDMSGTIEGTRLEVIRELICRFVPQKREIEKRDPALTGAVGLVSFSTRAREVMEMTPIGEAEAKARRAVRSMRPEASTDVCAGLNLAWRILRRDNLAAKYPDVGFVDRVVLLTDGEHNEGGHPVDLAGAMRADGILLFTIGVSSGIGRNEEAMLREMASVVDGDEWFRHVNSCDELVDCFAGLAGHITR